MRHKLTTFILKNPPGTKLNDTGTSLTERKDKKSKRKAENEANDDAMNGGNNGNHEANNSNEENDDDDDNWTVDVSEEAVKARQVEGLSQGIKALAVDDDIEKTEGERLDIFEKFVKSKLNAKASLDLNDEKEITTEAERLEVTNKGPLVLCVLLFDDKKILAQIKTYRRLMLRFCHENTKAQKYLMGGIEKTIETFKDSLLPKTGHILKAFFDLDILEEEVILEWGKKVSKKYVSKELSEQIHKKAEPFLTWLKEAEEESDDDEDSDVELEFDDRAKISTIKQVAENGNKNSKESTPASKQDEEEDDDLDIDDI
jgi:translation initiation factor 5